MSRTEELNERIRQRNVGDAPQFYFSPRPVPTKYTALPIIDELKPSRTTIQNKSTFDTSKHFLPGSSSPWSGWADNVNVETSLMRPKDYFPPTRSDLYSVTVPSKTETQPHPLLFATVKTNDLGVKPTATRDKTFFNNTSRIR